MTKEEHKRKLIDYLDDAIGARDYYLDTEDREMIIEALSQPERPKGGGLKVECLQTGKNHIMRK